MKIYAMTDVGRRREVNQDFVYVTDKPIGPFPNLLVVADGMGGHKAGDFASKYTILNVSEAGYWFSFTQFSVHCNFKSQLFVLDIIGYFFIKLLKTQIFLKFSSFL